MFRFNGRLVNGLVRPFVLTRLPDDAMNAQDIPEEVRCELGQSKLALSKRKDFEASYNSALKTPFERPSVRRGSPSGVERLEQTSAGLRVVSKAV
jgi:hypothetical protein